MVGEGWVRLWIRSHGSAGLAWVIHSPLLLGLIRYFCFELRMENFGS